MTPRVHVPVPTMRQSSAGTAHPPLFGVTPTRAWYAERMAKRAPWWRRIASKFIAASGATPPPPAQLVSGRTRGAGDQQGDAM